ncbi:MAG TPA: DUF1127 domain-containing protein [Dongiaceae bacterium]
MNRIINEKATLNLAVPATVARETGIAAVSRFGRAVTSTVRKHFKRAAIERELSRLDSRMLQDLGLTRGEIGYIAKTAVRDMNNVNLFAEFSRLLVNLFVRPVVSWTNRRKVYDTLMTMDDRMLADIGIGRYEIAEYVRNLGVSQGTLPESFAGMEQDVTAPLRTWNRARVTAKQLHELTDRQLLDIGVVRGEIGDLAHEVARKAATAANLNIEPKAA